MKTLTLDLQKRILIVEVGEIDKIIDVQPDFNTALLQGKKFIAVKNNQKLICKGDELNEEIAKGLIEKRYSNEYDCYVYKNYNSEDKNSAFDTPSLSFISAIEAKGFTWNGINPVSLEREKVYRQIGNDFTANGILKCWNEFEAKNFHSDRVLIFEIV